MCEERSMCIGYWERASETGRRLYIHSVHQRARVILSEFYHLRRTAIKDLAAYIGFLAGFIGAAPFAWGLLSDQLASGTFVRGLWYFFAIVIAAGIFTGTAGLGVGYVGGILWEQFHRSRRRRKLSPEPDAKKEDSPDFKAISGEPPALRLVSVESRDLPVIDGRVLRSIQFAAQSIDLDFGGIRFSVRGNPVTVCGGQRSRYPDPGSRDALCSLIGERVAGVHTPSAERVEIAFESGCELVMFRNSVAVA
jgi:hypothetical protein